MTLLGHSYCEWVLACKCYQFGPRIWCKIQIAGDIEMNPRSMVRERFSENLDDEFVVIPDCFDLNKKWKQNSSIECSAILDNPNDELINYQVKSLKEVEINEENGEMNFKCDFIQPEVKKIEEEREMKSINRLNIPNKSQEEQLRSIPMIPLVDAINSEKKSIEIEAINPISTSKAVAKNEKKDEISELKAIQDFFSNVQHTTTVIKFYFSLYYK